MSGLVPKKRAQESPLHQVERAHGERFRLWIRQANWSESSIQFFTASGEGFIAGGKAAIFILDGAGPRDVALMKIPSLAGVARSAGVGWSAFRNPESPLFPKGGAIFIARGAATRHEESKKSHRIGGAERRQSRK